jgi:hypothetical protein
MSEKLTFNLTELTNWMNVSEEFDERIQSVWRLFDDASFRRIPYEKLAPESPEEPAVFITVDLDVVRKKAYYHGRIKKAELELLIQEMRRVSR